MERERYDGNDVMHLLRARAGSLDWGRLIARFGGRWRVLLAHLILFGFVYPAERRGVPEAAISELLARLRAEGAADPPSDRVCQGTLLSRAQYLTDIGPWGYRDARLAPDVRMGPEDIERWTAGIAADGQP
jgi:hypothetical protein